MEEFNGLVMQKKWKKKFGLANVEPSRLVVARPKKILNEVIRSDQKERKFNKDVVKDINAWESFRRNCPTKVIMKNKA